MNVRTAVQVTYALSRLSIAATALDDLELHEEAAEVRALIERIETKQNAPEAS